jgi:hypothetical protein
VFTARLYVKAYGYTTLRTRTSTDWLHLRGALRGRCTGCDARTSTGCDARTSADWLHLRGALRCAVVAFARCGLVAVASADGAMLLTEGF